MRLCALRLIATGWKVLLPLPLTVAVVVVSLENKHRARSLPELTKNLIK